MNSDCTSDNEKTREKVTKRMCAQIVKSGNVHKMPLWRNVHAQRSERITYIKWWTWYSDYLLMDWTCGKCANAHTRGMKRNAASWKTIVLEATASSVKFTCYIQKWKAEKKKTKQLRYVVSKNVPGCTDGRGSGLKNFARNLCDSALAYIMIWFHKKHTAEHKTTKYQLLSKFSSNVFLYVVCSSSILKMLIFSPIDKSTL